MDSALDTISKLAEVTAEMAEIQDLGSTRLGELLELRGMLIRQLIAGHFDAGDNRLATIISNADRLQERLQKRAGAIRDELSGVKQLGALMSAVGSTLTPAESSAVDIRG